MVGFFKWVARGVFFFLVLSFALANMDVLSPKLALRFYGGTREYFLDPIPVWQLLIYSFFGGILFSYIGAMKFAIRDRAELRRLRKLVTKAGLDKKPEGDSGGEK